MAQIVSMLIYLYDTCTMAWVNLKSCFCCRLWEWDLGIGQRQINVIAVFGFTLEWPSFDLTLSQPNIITGIIIAIINIIKEKVDVSAASTCFSTWYCDEEVNCLISTPRHVEVCTTWQENETLLINFALDIKTIIIRHHHNHHWSREWNSLPDQSPSSFYIHYNTNALLFAFSHSFLSHYNY